MSGVRRRVGACSSSQRAPEYGWRAGVDSDPFRSLEMQHLRPRLYFRTGSGSQASTGEGAKTRVMIHFAAKLQRGSARNSVVRVGTVRTYSREGHNGVTRDKRGSSEAVGASAWYGQRNCQPANRHYGSYRDRSQRGGAHDSRCEIQDLHYAGAFHRPALSAQVYEPTEGARRAPTQHQTIQHERLITAAQAARPTAYPQSGPGKRVACGTANAFAGKFCVVGPKSQPQVLKRNACSKPWRHEYSCLPMCQVESGSGSRAKANSIFLRLRREDVLPDKVVGIGGKSERGGLSFGGQQIAPAAEPAGSVVVKKLRHREMILRLRHRRTRRNRPNCGSGWKRLTCSASMSCLPPPSAAPRPEFR
jgi:hypothetical protein